MQSPSRVTSHSVIEKQRVLDAHRAGRNWLAVAAYNGIAGSTAYDLVKRGRAENLPRGGRWNTKLTEEAKTCLERYLDDDCTTTLAAMRAMLIADCNIAVHTSTISRHLINMLYKQVRIEPTTCNNHVNKEKRRIFAEKLLKHQRKERGSIRMDKNAAFMEEFYQAVKASDTYKRFFLGKKVVIVLDNAPVHRQTEDRVAKHAEMKLLRLGPYSPMCNPIEGCFSVLKAAIKRRLALEHDEICNRSRESDANGEVQAISARQMRVLQRAANDNMKIITPALVTSMQLHCHDFVNKAAAGEDMVYGL